METRSFRKSSYSGAQASCVEVSLGHYDSLVRDSKSPDTGTITFHPAAFSDFVTNVRRDAIKPTTA